MAEDSLLYQLALTLIPGVGPVLGKKLVNLMGSAEAVFREKKHVMVKMGRAGEIIAMASGNHEIMLRAEKERHFIERYGITPLFFKDAAYPWRLSHCYDSPLLLFYKGNAGLNGERIVGIVGTRSATAYGRKVTLDLVAGLVPQGVLVVSGLAHGIDGCAHRAALDLGLDTVGILGHGLDRVYPYQHKPLAEKILFQGGLLTEFFSGTKPDRENFPMRNRIIAGLCDAIVVVEAAAKGGALITAEIANSYDRDVFAVPGRISDPFSEGTNQLVRMNKAALIQNADDLTFLMGWKQHPGSQQVVQKQLFREMTPDEEKIFNLIQERGQVGIDEIGIGSELSQGQVSTALLNLEFDGVVKSLPGKVYVLG